MSTFQPRGRRAALIGMVVNHGQPTIQDLNLFAYVSPASAAPEPANWARMLIGFGAMGLVLRRRPGGMAGAT